MIHEKKSFQAIVASLGKRSEASGDAEFVAEISALRGQLMTMVGALAACSISDDRQAATTATRALNRTGLDPTDAWLWLAAELDARDATMRAAGASPVAAN